MFKNWRSFKQPLINTLPSRSRTYRPYSTLPIRKKSSKVLIYSSLAFGSALSYIQIKDEFDHAAIAAVRSSRGGICAVRMIADYVFTLNFKSYDNEVLRLEAKSECHKRCAKILLDLCLTNGGVYIKLGQHIAALVYLLPPEYTSTFNVLQDKCTPSSLEEIESLFQKDLNTSISDLFIEFDCIPLGVASLAQVHKARLRSTGETVAVKIQHPSLDRHARVDIAATVSIVRAVKALFEQFEFGFLADEIQSSLPQELNFVLEAENARRCAKNFKGHPLLKVPEVISSSRRTLIMEYVEGGKIDNVDYMREHKINVKDLSIELARMYMKMIFIDRFIHCDPHPGNVFVKPTQNLSFLTRMLSYIPFFKPYNFEIVLLDHGLYREISKELSLDYAKLWQSLINGDEIGIEEHSKRLFSYEEDNSFARSNRKSRNGMHFHRLLASMLTGRSWAVVSDTKCGLGKIPTADELSAIQEKAASGTFVAEISQVLSALPRQEREESGVE